MSGTDSKQGIIPLLAGLGLTTALILFRGYKVIAANEENEEESKYDKEYAKLTES